LSNNKKVMLVDDEADITTILKIGLRRFGFDVDVFNDPRIALSQYKPNYYDAIVVDIRMPFITGFDLARKIWAKDPHARVCFCSAFEIYESEAKKVFVDFQTHCFIKKPIMPSELAKHLEAHFMAANNQ
jgi:DNA-binding response OmpR family regulator